MKQYKIMRFKWFLLLFLVAYFSSCGDEIEKTITNPLPQGKYPMEFTVKVNDSKASRATVDNAWEGGEEVGIGIGDEVKKYMVSDVGGNLISSPDASPFYWNNTGDIIVTAWYPFSATIPKTFIVQPNQEGSGYEQSDMIMACQMMMFAGASNNLQFVHLPAKVTINIINSESVNDVSNAIITLENVATTSGEIVADFSNISVAQAMPGSENIIPQEVSSTATKKTVQALIVPQNISERQFVKIEFNGNIYHYTPSIGEANFFAGKNYNFAITLR